MFSASITRRIITICFFACNWTSLFLWRKIRSWLRVNRCLATLNKATSGLNSRKKNLVVRMRRVSLSITVYLIWKERNKRIFDNTSNLVDLIFQKFQVFFYMILRKTTLYSMLNEGYGLGLFGGSVGLGNVCWLGSLPSYLCFIMQPMFYFFLSVGCR